jgi:hypothetical protein
MRRATRGARSPRPRRVPLIWGTPRRPVGVGAQELDVTHLDRPQPADQADSSASAGIQTSDQRSELSRPPSDALGDRSRQPGDGARAPGGSVVVPRIVPRTERNAENSPKTGFNGSTVDNGQCTEPLRVSCVHRGDLRGTHDRWSRQTRGGDPICAHHPASPDSRALVIMTSHNRPCAASISSAATTSGGRRCRTRSVRVRERDFDDVPHLKDRHRRAGPPRTTTHGK